MMGGTLGVLARLIAQWLGRLLAWLRRPRLKKRGALRPVLVTRDGVAVPSVRQVPVRSTKADAKRAALAFARRQWNDPTMTWGQARKRIQKLERELRAEGADIGEMSAGAEESEC